jgi:Arc/MetJ-type ribon-helix-helix transcriptional regulator
MGEPRSVRMDPDDVEQLEEEYGAESTSEAIRAAVSDALTQRRIDAYGELEVNPEFGPLLLALVIGMPLYPRLKSLYERVAA